MCTTCGCDSTNEVSIKKVTAADGVSASTAGMHAHTDAHGHTHWHSHDAPASKHEHETAHTHTAHAQAEGAPSHTRRLQLETDILQSNNLLAARNRGFFEGRNIFSINLVSSPGSGKTSLLEQTLKHLHPKVACAVIEGDQQTTNDAQRIAATGVPVVQINTGKGCHLDASMINTSLQQLPLPPHSLLFIENVGNLVCPAMFDLGEQARVVISSVTEGDDKPLKYPDMFRSAQLCIINKTDLLPYVPFDVEQFKENALTIQPQLQFIAVSAYKNEGLQPWYNWLMKGKEQQHIVQ